MPIEFTTISTPPHQEELQKTLKKKYGAPNWYEWNFTNWGTKWDLCDVTVEKGSIILLDERKRSIIVTFNTAWSPPLAAFDTIAKKFPKLCLKLDYAESGAGFCGKVTWKDGKKVSDESRSDYKGSRGG